MINENQLRLSKVDSKFESHIDETLFKKEEFDNAIVTNIVWITL